MLEVLSVLLIVAVIIVVGMGFKKPKQVIHAPQVDSQDYELLEPEEWIGKELPILDYIDINDKLKTGNWLVLFYHYDCPGCQEAMAELEKLSPQARFEGLFFDIAIIEVPPYGNPIETNCLYGRLFDVKEWFITTPAIVLLKNGEVTQTWEQKLPDWGSVLDNIYAETKGKSLLAGRR